MASGWWKSTHENLTSGSPVDFDVTMTLQAPRGYPKLASIATGAGLFLGGTPSITINNVLHYAGDSYTQDTDEPPLMRFDGSFNTQIATIPDLLTVPSKAILSLAKSDDESMIFISTWDSGTTSADFAGRVFVLEDGTLTRIDEGLFTGGKLPYALVWFNSTLYVGVTEQNPAVTSEVVKINFLTTRSGGPVPSLVLNGTTYTYQIGGLNNAAPALGAYVSRSDHITVKNRAVLGASVFNDLSWNNPGGATLSYRAEREAGGSTQGVIADITPASTVTFRDDGDAATGAVAPDDTPPLTITLTVTPTPAEATCTYRVGAFVGGVEYLSTAVNVTGRATLFSDLYIAISWGSVAGATIYKVYRTAGHTSTGLIGSTSSTSFNDTGLAGTGSVPALSSSIALTSGAVGALTVFGSDLYVGSYQPSGTFGTVYKITTSDVLSTSDTVAPGGTAQAYNGFTAGTVFESNLYMAYWNDDATDKCTIRKFTGSVWSDALALTGASARPIVAFSEHDGTLYAYGGGDGVTGILHSTVDGASWTNRTSLLPTSKEAVPFMGTVNVIGGF